MRMDRLRSVKGRRGLIRCPVVFRDFGLATMAHKAALGLLSGMRDSISAAAGIRQRPVAYAISRCYRRQGGACLTVRHVHGLLRARSTPLFYRLILSQSPF
jgi:hypothetical protein